MDKINFILLLWHHVSVKAGRDIYLAEQSKTVFSPCAGRKLPAPSGLLPMYSSGLGELGESQGQ